MPSSSDLSMTPVELRPIKELFDDLTISVRDILADADVAYLVMSTRKPGRITGDVWEREAKPTNDSQRMGPYTAAFKQQHGRFPNLRELVRASRYGDEALYPIKEECPLFEVHLLTSGGRDLTANRDYAALHAFLVKVAAPQGYKYHSFMDQQFSFARVLKGNMQAMVTMEGATMASFKPQRQREVQVVPIKRKRIVDEASESIKKLRMVE